MTEQAQDRDVGAALYELQQYLSDELAPIMVIAAVDVLLKTAPAVVATGIHGWVTAQYSGVGASVPVSDYIFHSLKKIYLLADLNLLERERIKPYVEQLGQLVLEFCPEDDRETLWTNIAGLGALEVAKTARVEIVHRQIRAGESTVRVGDDAPVSRAGALAASADRGSRGLALLVDRLERATGVQGRTASRSGEGHGELLTHILARAAMQSGTEAELERHLRPLAKMGVDAALGQVFRALGRSLPEWTPAPDSAAASAVSPRSDRAVDAMRRIISMAGDEKEGTKRFGEMVDAAIEQFNSGSLVQAATMFDLAEQVVKERKLTPELLASIRTRGRDALAVDQLRRFAEKPETHRSLRTVLNFFPGLTVRGLLGDLEEETKRDRRKLLLALLESHGLPARSAALERLQFHRDGDMDPRGFVRRNMVYLLRRIPVPAGTNADDELGLLEEGSKLTNPLILVREAVSALGQLSRDDAEHILMARLGQIEQMLMTGEMGGHEERVLTMLLDRTVSALGSSGSSRALRAVLEHALKRKKALGDTLARLEVLSGHDLSGDKDLVARLVEMLKADLPVVVLGFVIKNEHKMLAPLIRALSSTAAPAVREVMEEIVRRFPDREFAADAAKVLSGFGAGSRPAEAPAEMLSGEVELFGLPNLFQVLAESRLTGVLTLANGAGEQIGMVSLEEGKISDCETGPLRGKAAFYQLFEAPVRGGFSFHRQRELSKRRTSGEPLLEVLPMVVEGVRRHDEFREASILVTGNNRLAATSTSPTPPGTDEERSFVDMVWKKVTAGVTPHELEDALGVDPYRVRHLLAHWVEEGSLKSR